ncbi:MAG: YncE family protein [Phocaeicola sp.]|nr:YncE family protein [Phocaeicola sp.]
MKSRLLIVPLLIILLLSCRGELPLIHSEGDIVDDNPEKLKYIKGLYLLNEGNMGSNKCSIDYYDYTSGEYHRNIYAEMNPDIVKELGDVGNDIQIYDGKLFVVVNCSHFVEVMDVCTARHIGKVDITNCRYIRFNGDKAYVSSYAGPVQIDPEARPGKIVEFDVNTLKIEREVVVGYQPEEMVITDGKLYVANSGGYRFPNYDRTVSVVDLETFKVINTIDVAINLHRMELDRYGHIYVSSRGDYEGTGSDVFVIDSKTDKVIGSLGIAASEMCLSGDSIFMISTEWSKITGTNKVTYTIYDTKQQKKVSDSFITDGTEDEIKLPYGIAINPENRDFFICDATNYVTPGYLYCFTPDGKKKWKVRTGDIPAHIVFTEENVEF